MYASNSSFDIRTFLGFVPSKARRPVELVYFEEFETKEQAMKREYAIKQMARKDKLELVRKKEKADDRSE